MKNPTTVIWVLIHLVLLLFGYSVISTTFFGLSSKEFADAIGGSIFSAALVGLFITVYVSMSDTLSNDIKLLTQAGITRVFQSRSVTIKHEYDSRLRGATRIWVLGYGLSSFLDDYRTQFPAWSQRADVRILMLDPAFPAGAPIATLRDAEEQSPEGQIAGQVGALIEEYRRNDTINKKRFKLRLMRAIPSVNIMIIDDVAFWGPYLYNKKSRNTITFIVRRGGFIFESLEAHFSALWDNAANDVAEQ